ncbi:MAG: exodeoxyribonuclease VII large subunit [Myxococcota bacterium]|jgi:exodeoxyribonuclease VII large subunit|nr:exodeoxyribonuclease VII large subunit [Myxococcota bacterium]
MSFPYDEQLLAVVRRLPGRLWAPSRKAWTCPLNAAVEACKVLASHGFKAAPEVLALVPTAPSSLRLEAAIESKLEQPPPAPVQRVAMGIRELNELLKRTLEERFERELWVVGEVFGFDRRRAAENLFFELVEKAEDAARATVQARIGAVIWARDRDAIDYRLRSAPIPFEICDGLRLRVRGRVGLFPGSGKVVFAIRELDPSYTIGELTVQRRLVLERLEAMGLLRRNLELPLPLLPLRIALLTSRDGEALADFVEELRRSGFAFQVDLYGVKVQGDALVPSMLSALKAVEKRHRRAPYDVVVLVRGGGSRADLMGFDRLELAVAVAALPIKVLLGIGHQRDRSVLDEIAHSEKTPTAVAATLVAAVQQTDTFLWQGLAWALEQARTASEAWRAALEDLAQGLRRETQERLTQAMVALDRSAEKLSWAARLHRRRAYQEQALLQQRLRFAIERQLERRRQSLEARAEHLSEARVLTLLANASMQLEGLAAHLEPAAMRAMRRAEDALGGLEERSRVLDPRRVMARGFARLRDDDGRVLSRVSGLRAGQRVQVELVDGVLVTRIEQVNEAERQREEE